MCQLKFTVLILVSFMLLNVTGLNEKQMKAAVKMVRNVCQPKFKATDVDIDKMHKGDWNIDHTAMCYMHCAMNMYKLMNTDNSFNYQSALAQLNQLPDSYKKATEICMEQCKDSAVTLSDKCISAYELAKCMYFCNPEKYFLP
uniref:Odorant binding protein 2 n=1 Tax=Colaphellus bowringi TaxID=561076 RepID=A0A0S3J2J2_9CUCU|nr:odorant binding protein 2 [Colaphellus bowringi]